MYKSEEEIFADVLAETGLSAHPRALHLSACANTLLLLNMGDLSELTHEQMLVLAKQIGFEFASHEEARLVVQAVQLFVERQEEHEAEERKRPFRSFSVHIYRDRNGRLMATFSMGKTTFRTVALEESWERKFAQVYQDTLLEALKHTGAHAVHQPEDTHLHDG